jgi:hypothetical protein
MSIPGDTRKYVNTHTQRERESMETERDRAVLATGLLLLHQHRHRKTDGQTNRHPFSLRLRDLEHLTLKEIGKTEIERRTCPYPLFLSFFLSFSLCCM